MDIRLSFPLMNRLISCSWHYCFIWGSKFLILLEENNPIWFCQQYFYWPSNVSYWVSSSFVHYVIARHGVQGNSSIPRIINSTKACFAFQKECIMFAFTLLYIISLNPKKKIYSISSTSHCSTLKNEYELKKFKIHVVYPKVRHFWIYHLIFFKTFSPLPMCVIKILSIFKKKK